MALRTDITNLKLHVVAQLPLNCEVILHRGLGAHLGLEFTEQQHRLINTPVLGCARFWRDDPIEGIKVCRNPVLTEERIIELGFRGKLAATEGRLSAELLEN